MQIAAGPGKVRVPHRAILLALLGIGFIGIVAASPAPPAAGQAQPADIPINVLGYFNCCINDFPVSWRAGVQNDNPPAGIVYWKELQEFHEIGFTQPGTGNNRLCMLMKFQDSGDAARAFTKQCGTIHSAVNYVSARGGVATEIVIPRDVGRGVARVYVVPALAQGPDRNYFDAYILKDSLLHSRVAGYSDTGEVRQEIDSFLVALARRMEGAAGIAIRPQETIAERRLRYSKPTCYETCRVHRQHFEPIEVRVTYGLPGGVPGGISGAPKAPPDEYTLRRNSDFPNAAPESVNHGCVDEGDTSAFVCACPICTKTSAIGRRPTRARPVDTIELRFRLPAVETRPRPDSWTRSNGPSIGIPRALT